MSTNTLNIAEFLTGLKSRRITFEVKDDQLKINAPKGKLTRDLVAEIKGRKDEILSFLKAFQVKEVYEGVERVERRDFYPVSPAQRRLYILWRMRPDTTAYNMPYTLPLDRQMEEGELEKMFGALMDRHEILRTSFVNMEGDPFQRVHDTVSFKVDYFDGEALEGDGGIAGVTAEFVRPFDLSEAPLFRVGLIRGAKGDDGGEGKDILLLDLHHIVTDAVSQGILKQDLMALYMGKGIGDGLQYKDYCVWLQGSGRQDVMKRQAAFWVEQFKGELPLLTMPLDFPRPVMQQFDGASTGFVLEAEASKALTDAAAEADVTLYMMLLALFDVLLFKLSGQEDVVVGAPVAGRGHADLQGIVGMFVNTLAFRSYPEGKKTFDVFLKEVKGVTLKAFDNQDYPFEELVDAVSVPRDTGRNPLFDVMFNFLSTEAGAGEIQATTGDYEKSVAKFDLTLTAVERRGEGRIRFDLQYCTHLFTAETIDRFMGYFRSLLTGLPGQRHVSLADVEILSEEEKKDLLVTFNDTARDYPAGRSLHGMFLDRAEGTPGAVAIMGQCPVWAAGREERAEVAAGNAGFTPVTYGELKEYAQRLAVRLGVEGVSQGQVVALMGHHSVEMVTAILGVLMAGAAYLPIDPAYPMNRKSFILQDSGVDVLLLHGEVDTSGLSFEGHSLDLAEASIYEGLHEGLHEGSGASERVAVEAEDTAYIIYTSGSTGNPKGVILPHRAAVNYITWAGETYTDDDTLGFPLFTSISFDLTVTSIFTPLSMGSKIVVYGSSDNEIPLTAILDDGLVDTVKLTPTHLRLVKDRDNRSSRVRRLIVGGEQLETSLAAAVTDSFGGKVTIYNEYGPTEATVGCMIYIYDKERDKRTAVPIGKPAGNMQIYLVDGYDNPVPTGVEGEMIIAGKAIANGYLNRPKLSTEKFQSLQIQQLKLQIYNGEVSLKHSSSSKAVHIGGPGGASPWPAGRPLGEPPEACKAYRTGDLARFLPDGNIEFVGRMDHQVKIRGYRIELGEIEARLLQHEHVGEAVVIDRPDPAGDLYLCAYIVASEAGFPGEPGMERELKDYLSETLPDYMVPSFLVPLETIPVTPNGKVDRAALPEPERKSGSLYVAPRNPVEKTLAGIWADVLLGDNEKWGEIGINDNFFQLGGNSIKIMKVAAQISRELELEVPILKIMEKATVSQLGDYIAGAEGKGVEKASYPSVTPDPANLYEPFPITDIQMAYLMGRSSRIEMGGVSTHGYQEIKAVIDFKRFNDALDKVIMRHPMLRAIIREDGHQQVLEEVKGYRIEMEDLSHMDAAGQAERIKKERERMAHYVFLPEQWPLFDFKAFKVAPRTYYFCIGTDPLVADAFSSRIIVQELHGFYLDPQLEPRALEFSFRDYMLAYVELKDSPLYQRDKDYWLKQLEDFPFAPQLPMRCKPSDVAKPTFKRLSRIIDRETWTRLKGIAGSYSVTPSTLLCTAYSEVLAYWSNQTRFAVNLTVFNRFPFHRDVDKIVGDFTSLILLGVLIRPNAEFWQRASEVQETMFQGLEHRHYDGIEFIREFSKLHDLVNKAVMPIVFTSAIFGDDGSEREAPGGDGEDLVIEFPEGREGVAQTSQVFIDNAVGESGGNLAISWNYVDELFEPEVIETMFKQYILRLTNLANGIDEKVFRPRLEERQKILEYNETEQEIPVTTLHHMFEKQLEKTPDNIAVLFGEEMITYDSFARKANRIARYLRSLGVGRNQYVGVLTPRSIETIINVMGVVKSGGAYIPIDPDYPEQRRDYILNNSNCAFLIEPGEAFEEAITGFSDEPLDNVNSPDDIAYAIYTSGSTGRPKGVVIKHCAAANTIIDINRRFEVGEEDRIIGISSMCFDLSVYDVFGALGCGAALVLIRDQRDIRDLIDTVETYRVTVWNSVPAIMDITANTIAEDLGGGKSVKGLPQAPPEREIAIDEDSEHVYYWSPAVFWKRTENHVRIGEKVYSGAAQEVFPEFYFLTQDGVAVKALFKNFPAVKPEELSAFVEELVRERVLVDSILSPLELYGPQSRLFKHDYSEAILYDPEAFNEFKSKQLNRTFDFEKGEGIKLEGSGHMPAFIKDRRSYRQFEEKRKITYRDFADLMAVFRQTEDDEGTTWYYYASSDGLYPVDVYVYVKSHRVENVEGGLYYYNPVDHGLTPIYKQEVITEDAHFLKNKSIFRSSAFSIFMLYNAEASMPKNGALGYFMSGIDAGIMVDTLTHMGEILDIGICSIGNMDFNKVKPYFHLNKNQVFLHAVEVGLKPESGETGLRAGEELLALNADPAESRLAESEVNDMAAAALAEGFRNTHLRVVMMSGDWIPLACPDNVKTFFPRADVYSLGGATEGSIWSIYYPIGKVREEWKSIPYGFPLANQTYYVLNDEFVCCPVGVQGELYIGGAGVAEGYLNDVEKTQAAYIEHPQWGRIYRTGDYGALLKDGYIEFLGRKDHQVKISGYRVELGEIESRLLEHEMVKNAVVIDRSDANGKKYLAAYLTVEADLPVQELRTHLTEELPNYMIPSYFLFLDAIPLTPNGKVDRKALPEPDADMLTVEDDFEAPVTAVEEELVDIWKAVLGKDAISTREDFFMAGGDSIKAIQILGRMKKSGYQVGMRDIFQYATISELAAAVGGDVEAASEGVGQEEEPLQLSYDGLSAEELARLRQQYQLNDLYPLSPMQEGMLFHTLYDRESAVYFQQMAYRLQGVMDEGLVERALNQLMARHDVLRTLFIHEDLERPLQLVLAERKVEFYFEDLGNITDPQQREERLEAFKMEDRARGFDLEKDVLMRVALFRLGEGIHEFIWSYHHILMDAWCVGILVVEYLKLVTGLTTQKAVQLPEVKPYAQYIQWLEKQEKEATAVYWRQYMEGYDEVSGIPIKKKADPGAGYLLETVEQQVSGVDLEALHALAARNRVTLNTVIQSLWGTLLNLYNRRSDAAFAAVVSGRPPEIDGVERMVGLFINTIPVRIRCDAGMGFNSILHKIQAEAIDSESHHYFPLAEIQADTVLKQDLLDHIMVFENAPLSEGKEGMLTHGGEDDGSPLRISDAKGTSQTNYPLAVVVIPAKPLRVILKYNANLYHREVIEGVARHFLRLVEQVIADETVTPADLNLLTDEEKRTILETFNDTSVPYDWDKTIPQCFEAVTARTPNALAVTGHDGENVSAGARSLTYGELNIKADSLAARLRAEGLQAGEIVPLWVDRSVDTIVAILGILKGGGAYMPIDPNYPETRTGYLLADCNGKLLVRSKAFSGQLKLDYREVWVDDERIYKKEPLAGADGSSPADALSSTDPAYVIYTSGSTGYPKGVMVTHRNVINLVTGLEKRVYWRYSEEERPLRVALVAPYIFDASVKQVFAALLMGHSLHVVPEGARVDGEQLSAFYHHHKIDLSDGTPAHLALLLESPGKRDFMTVRHFLVGGEALQEEMVKRFFGRFHKQARRITNVYGPAECCVDSACCDITPVSLEKEELISIGQPMANQAIYILDDQYRLLPAGMPGQLCIGGSSVSNGYLNNPQMTAEKFIQNPFAGDSEASSLYLTGDLARWLPEGNIQFLGRMDHQVKIRGYRIELGEIEDRLLKKEGIKEAVVLAGEDGDGDKHIHAYYVADSAGKIGDDTVFQQAKEIKDYLSQYLPAYMVPAFVIPLEKIPLTPNGKVDTRALPEPEMMSAPLETAPRNDLEKKLAEIWAEVLKVGEEGLGIDASFFDLGGHSLKATRLIALIHKKLNVRMPLSEVFGAPTIRHMAEFIRDASMENRYAAIEPAERKEFYPVSSAQKRLFILQQMEPENVGYNMPQVVRFDEAIDKDKLEKAFKALIQRHESLRTSFVMRDGEPFQRIHETVDFTIEEAPASALTSGSRFTKPFDLTQAPLLRVVLLQQQPEKNNLSESPKPSTSPKAVQSGVQGEPPPGAPRAGAPGGPPEARNLLLVDMHHIITDGVSQGILRREFMALYKGEALPGLRLQYKDYSEWQHGEGQREMIGGQGEYWLSQFADEVPVLELPTDSARPLVQSYEGGSVNVMLNEVESRGLKELAAETGSTLYMTLFSLFSLFLSKLSGQEDIVVGTPVAARRHADLEKIIGMLVNTLAIRSYPKVELTFHQFMKEVKVATLAAFENQEYPFEDLVDAVVARRDTSRNPLFDVMFNLVTREEDAVTSMAIAHLPGGEHKKGVAKFDLVLSAVERKEQVLLSFEYSSRLFRPETLDRFINYFRRILSSILADSDRQLREVSIISPEETAEILNTFNDTAEDFPVGQTINGVFDQQVEKMPGNIAAVFGGEQLTYRQLQNRAETLAKHLVVSGVKPGAIVGLMVPRSLEMFIGMIGILKAGAAYCPIDPTAPAKRTTFLLADSAAAALVTLESLTQAFTEDVKFAGPVIGISPIDGNDENVENNVISTGTEVEIILPAPAPDRPAYVIYTSGSTGTPKGVVVLHRTIMNTLMWRIRCYGIASNHSLLQIPAFTFDSTVGGIFSFLLVGAKIVVMRQEDRHQVDYLKELLETYDITHFLIVPAYYKVFLEELSDSMKQMKGVTVGGEAFTSQLVETHFRKLPKVRLFNEYGPTENSVCSTVHEFDKDHTAVIIGKPISNVGCYIVDKNKQLNPVGIPGELWLSGAGLAAGYLNNPEMTAEKFFHCNEKNLSPQQQPTRFYRTGDLVRWLPDGNIQFLGRIDFQVKIRGFRIELGEIEAHLTSHQGINESVVITRKGHDGNMELCAYIIPAAAPDIAGPTSPVMDLSIELKRYLSHLVPDYMIPAHFVELEKIPLTAHGKLDRKALPEPSVSIGSEYVAPVGEIEQGLAEIWAEVLSIDAESIGVDSNFFDLGGNSLSILKLNARIKERFAKDIPAATMFRLTTISALASFISQEEEHIDMQVSDDEINDAVDSVDETLSLLMDMDED